VGRNGSRYGQFDVLALDSLSRADLSQYGVIIAPMALYLPQGAQLALHNYVMTGGVLVADAGVGMYQAEGAVTSLPDVLKHVFGLRYGPGEEAWSAAATPGQVQVGDVGEVPTLLYETPRELQRARDDDLAKLAQTLDEVLDRPMLADYLGMEFLSADAPGFRVNKLGRGYGIYAPRFLYEDWNALDPYFIQFHARVLANGSDLAVLEPAGLWPGVSVGAYSGWSVGFASPDGMPASVALYGGGNQVYHVASGAMRVGNPADGDWVELLFPGSPLSVATPLPVYAGTAQQGGVAAVSVVRYDSERIELAIHGNGAQVTAENGGIVVRGGVHTAVEVVVRDGRYPVGPGSLHRVSVTEGGAGGRDWEQEIMPNPETGVLVIQGRFASSRLIIEPAPEES